MQVTSKAFRATLPRMDDTQLERLQIWTAENCASGLAFRDGGCVVWLVSRERAKTKEALLAHELFSAMPPWECVRTLLSFLVTDGHHCM